MLEDKIRRKNLEYLLYRVLDDEYFSVFRKEQREILYYITLGYSDTEIIKEINCDQFDIDSIRKQCYSKFNVESDHRLSIKIWERLLYIGETR
jgi:DNA-binding NarL/FixJ family response regulator